MATIAMIRDAMHRAPFKGFTVPLQRRPPLHHRPSGFRERVARRGFARPGHPR